MLAFGAQSCDNFVGSNAFVYFGLTSQAFFAILKKEPVSKVVLSVDRSSNTAVFSYKETDTPFEALRSEPIGCGIYFIDFFCIFSVLFQGQLRKDVSELDAEIGPF